MCDDQPTETDIGWFRLIFSYLGPTHKEIRCLRNFCTLFSKALKPLPCWTSFPHPKYSSLRGLVDRFNDLSEDESNKIPALLFLADGVHEKINVQVVELIMKLCMSVSVMKY